MIASNDDKAVRVFDEEGKQQEKNLTSVWTWQGKCIAKP